jgi:hypothetical protein
MNENGEFFEKIITKPIYNKYLILIFLYSIYIYYIILDWCKYLMIKRIRI